MAIATLSTSVSRRAMLAGAPAAIVLGGSTAAARVTGTPAGTPNDDRLAALAAGYWRIARRIHALIDEAERRRGPCAWLEPPYAALYDDLAGREERFVAAIAETPPDGIAGLATKMRVATLGQEGQEGPGYDILEPVFRPALRDLARLAAEAAP